MLITYLRNCNCPQQQWGMRALMYVPPDAVRAFYTSKGTTAAAATGEQVTWEAVTNFCTQHQVAHLQTDGDVRHMLAFQCRQRNPNTRVTVPLGDHLAAYEAAAAKCTHPMDPATAVFMCRTTLHPALQSAVRINPQTNHEFQNYQELREYLVQFKPEAERLIRDWERLHQVGNNTKPFGGRPFSGNSRPFNGSGNGSGKPLGVRGGVRKPRLSDSWTKEQRDIAAKGICVYFQKPFIRPHNCLKQVSEQPDSTHPCSSTADTLSNTAEPADTNMERTNMTAMNEPTFDEMIEAFVAVDEIRLREQQLQAHFVLSCVNRAQTQSVAAMQTRNQHKRVADSDPVSGSEPQGLPVNPPVNRNKQQEDMRLVPAEFQKLKAKLNIEFTLDATAGADGSKAVCTHYCSSLQSFTATDLANQIVWLNPPFGQLTAYLDHFMEQKQAHPELSGAVLA